MRGARAVIVLALLAASCGLKKRSGDDGGVALATVDAGAAIAAVVDAGLATQTNTINPVVGSFSGQVTEKDLKYTITLALDDKTGTVAYSAPFDCKGTWTQTSHDGKTWTYKEHITEQKGTKRCADGETATIIQIYPSQFQYVEGTAHATLTKH